MFRRRRQHDHTAVGKKSVLHPGKEDGTEGGRGIYGLCTERAYTKNEILELYVNTIYFGNGYYCIKDASEGYFGKEPEDLTEL